MKSLVVSPGGYRSWSEYISLDLSLWTHVWEQDMVRLFLISHVPSLHNFGYPTERHLCKILPKEESRHGSTEHNANSAPKLALRIMLSLGFH